MTSDPTALREGEFWRSLPGYAGIDTKTFLDHRWQARNSITRLDKLRSVLGDLSPESLFSDLSDGLARAPMSLRISPYLLSLINWNDPGNDPIRKQFLPLALQLLPDHPRLTLDSLNEQADTPLPGLIHRYPDKVLFLALDTCPIYCRFCTRSYTVGPDTDQVDKPALHVNHARWTQTFDFIRNHPEIEDILVSGGDIWQLRTQQLEHIGKTLLAIPNVRRIRFATRGLAAIPQKILTDHDWCKTLAQLAHHGRRLHKEVAVHTHFNHPNEFTWISAEATDRLMELGITMRNQSVLLRGVNDDAHTMSLLVRRLGYHNVHPYYVYLHDMIPGLEDLRTTVATAVELEKAVRGTTAGFNTPTFVCDAPGGGGKRDIHSYEHYNPQTGISVYSAPAVKPDRLFLYYDPIGLLPEAGQRRWSNADEHQRMIDEAIAAARARKDGTG
jgi:lysine 2,3-aminomutase